jgi:hypothetical protein
MYYATYYAQPFLAYNFLSLSYQIIVTDKKIIDKKDVKENNPNDDEEILNNNPDLILESEIDNEEGPDDKNEKSRAMKPLETLINDRLQSM